MQFQYFCYWFPPRNQMNYFIFEITFKALLIKFNTTKDFIRPPIVTRYWSRVLAYFYHRSYAFVSLIRIRSFSYIHIFFLNEKRPIFLNSEKKYNGILFLLHNNCSHSPYQSNTGLHKENNLATCYIIMLFLES